MSHHRVPEMPKRLRFPPTQFQFARQSTPITFEGRFEFDDAAREGVESWDSGHVQCFWNVFRTHPNRSGLKRWVANSEVQAARVYDCGVPEVPAFVARFCGPSGRLRACLGVVSARGLWWSKFPVLWCLALRWETCAHGGTAAPPLIVLLGCRTAVAQFRRPIGRCALTLQPWPRLRSWTMRWQGGASMAPGVDHIRLGCFRRPRLKRQVFSDSSRSRETCCRFGADGTGTGAMRMHPTSLWCDEPSGRLVCDDIEAFSAGCTHREKTYLQSLC